MIAIFDVLEKIWFPHSFLSQVQLNMHAILLKYISLSEGAPNAHENKCIYLHIHSATFAHT